MSLQCYIQLRGRLVSKLKNSFLIYLNEFLGGINRRKRTNFKIVLSSLGKGSYRSKKKNLDEVKRGIAAALSPLAFALA